MARGSSTPPVRFDAFISYSHAADGRLAPALRDGLEQLARPWLRRRALRVFHDSTGLAATPGLWSTIATALGSTRFFVLLASPEAASSGWVRQEVEYFLEVGAADRLLIVLTGGDCRWDAARGDFDWTVTTALPPQLAGVFAEEPLYVDLRWARSEAQLDLRNARFRQAVADLAAPIHGLPRDEVDAIDLAEFSKARRARRAAVAAISALAVLSLVAGLVAVDNARTARRQAAVSEAGRLAALGVSLANDRTGLAVLLARHSLRTSRSADGERALAYAMTRPAAAYEPLPGTESPGGGLVSLGDNALLAVDGTGSTIALGRQDDVLIWSVERAAVAATVPMVRSHLRRVDLSDDGGTLVTVDRIEDEAVVTDIPSLSQRARRPAADAMVLPDGDLVTVTPDGVVERSHGRTVRWRREIEASYADYFRLALNNDGSRVAVATDKGTVDQFNTADGDLLWHREDFGSLFTLAYSHDGRWLAIGGSQVEVLNAERGGRFRHYEGIADDVGSVAFTRDDSALVVGVQDGALLLFDRYSARLVGELSGHDDAVSGLVASPDGSSLYSVAIDGLRRWDLRTGRPAYALAVPHDNPAVAKVLASPDGTTVAAVSLRHTDLWRVGDTAPYLTIDVTADTAAFVSDRVLAILRAAPDQGDTGLYDVTTGQLIGTVPGGGSLGHLLASRDGRLVTLSHSGQLTVWDPTTRSALRRFRVGRANVREAAMSADGRVVAIVLPDGIEVYDGDTGALLSRWAPGDIDLRRFQTYRVAVRPDGAEVAIGQPSGRVVRVDARSGGILGEFRALGGNITALAYSVDGTMVAAAGGEQTAAGPSMRLIDADSGLIIADREAHDQTIRSVVFSRDARWLLSGAEDGQLLIWSAAAEWTARSCELVGRDLTDAERTRYLRAEDRAARVC